MFPYPVLVCDIGGTNARFALAVRPGEFLLPLANLQTVNFTGLGAAACAALSGATDWPASLLVCAAGPVENRQMKLTNGSWVINGKHTISDLGLKQGILLNDFEALAFSMPSLEQADFHRIGPLPVPSVSDAPRLILGPGTGLGASLLLNLNGQYACVPCEAGHIALASACIEEQEIFRRLDRPFGRLTAETVLSGPGLTRLHYARLQDKLSEPDSPKVEAAEIVERALKHPEGPEAATLLHFWRIMARFSGDMALALGARGGVTLAGGVLPKLLTFLREDSFREGFENKSPLRAYVRQIPTALLLDEVAPLKGMRDIADRPDAFAIRYVDRCWA